MNGKLRSRCALALVLTVAVPELASAGSGTPEAALVEIVLATTPEIVEKHLPNSLCEGLHTLTPDERRAFEAKLMFAESFRQMEMQLHVPDGGDALLVAERPGSERRFELNVDRELIAGSEAMLQVRLHGGGARIDTDALVWMKLEDGEWRVSEVQWLHFADRNLVLDDPKFLDQFRRPQEKANESSAVSVLQEISFAVGMYANRFPEIGYPEDLARLGPGTEDDSEPQPEQAGLLQSAHAANSFQSDGYVFHYRLQRGGTDGAYWLTARPLQYTKTGTNSFYIDESGVIRVTGEDRDPTSEDDPLQ